MYSVSKKSKEQNRIGEGTKVVKTLRKSEVNNKRTYVAEQLQQLQCDKVDRESQNQT